MIDLHPLVTLSFWFDLHPHTLSAFFSQAFFLVFAGIMILGSLARIVAKNKKHDKLMRDLYLRIASALLTMGALGILWFFFAFEEVYLFGARFWFALWLIGVVVYAITLVRFGRSIPQLRIAQETRSAENTYLPRRNR